MKAPKVKYSVYIKLQKGDTVHKMQVFLRNLLSNHFPENTMRVSFTQGRRGRGPA